MEGRTATRCQSHQTEKTGQKGGPDNTALAVGRGSRADAADTGKPLGPAESQGRKAGPDPALPSKCTPEVGHVHGARAPSLSITALSRAMHWPWEPDPGHAEVAPAEQQPGSWAERDAPSKGNESGYTHRGDRGSPPQS